MGNKIAVYEDTTTENWVLLEQADGTLAPLGELDFVKEMASFCEGMCEANAYIVLTPKEVEDSKGPQLGYLKGGEYHAL